MTYTGDCFVSHDSQSLLQPYSMIPHISNLHREHARMSVDSGVHNRYIIVSELLGKYLTNRDGAHHDGDTVQPVA